MLDQIDLIDIYRTIHPKTAEYMLFSSTYEISSKIDHVVGHKTRLNKIEIISSLFFFFNHNGMTLESTTGKKLENTHTHTQIYGGD